LGARGRPAKQRGGSGTALLNTLFEKTDREGLPIYLETHRLKMSHIMSNGGFI
jgi:hypothetical protein